MRDLRSVPARRIREGLAVLLNAGLLLAFVAMATGCGHKVRQFPEELIGRWETSLPKYRDTYMEFSLENIVLGTLEGPQEYELDYIESEEVPGEIRHVIHYHQRGGERYSMSLNYSPAGGGTLTDQNQQTLVWRKVRSPGE